MNKIKSVLAMLLTALMVLALGSPVKAEDTYSVTVTDVKEGAVYKVYQMLGLSVNLDANPAAYSYSLTNDWKEFFTTGEGKNYVDVDDQNYVTWKTYVDDGSDSTTMINFGKDAATYVAKKSLKPAVDEQEAKASGGSITFTGLKPGYYLVTSTFGTRAMVLTTPANSNATVNEKNIPPTVTKNVEEDSDGTYGINNDADISQKVNFKAEVNVTHVKKNYVLHDTMTEGLTFNNDVVVKLIKANTTAEIDVDAANYTVTFPATDGHTFDVTFVQNYMDGLDPGDKLVARYSANLNANAVVAGEGNKNTIQLTWGETSEFASDEDTTITKTWEVQVHKYTNGNDENPVTLAGAQFVLYKNVPVLGEDGNPVLDTNGKPTYAKSYATVSENKVTGWTDASTGTAVMTSPATGNIIIQGLDSDVYYLEEKTPPTGYNKLASAIEFKIDNDGKVFLKNGDEYDEVTVTVQSGTAENPTTETVPSLVLEVENKAGSVLPGTGGTGTVIFTVLGSILVVGAGVLLVVKRRMSTAE